MIRRSSEQGLGLLLCAINVPYTHTPHYRAHLGEVSDVNLRGGAGNSLVCVLSLVRTGDHQWGGGSGRTWASFRSLRSRSTKTRWCTVRASPSPGPWPSSWASRCCVKVRARWLCAYSASMRAPGGKTSTSLNTEVGDWAEITPGLSHCNLILDTACLNVS